MGQTASQLSELFTALADTLDGDLEIEKVGRSALLNAAEEEITATSGAPFSQPYLEIFKENDAHPVCQMITQANFDWVPPSTSDDPLYVAHSVAKAHVELVGPDGLAKSDEVRMGLYGMLPGHEYGLRTHLAEEVFVMLAGEADWKRGERNYEALRAGARSYHPSMTPHANRTRNHAFMSIYVWYGDVSTDSYVYQGIPDN
ncbi:MAG: dimethylsulfonioproprionate lyase family protein [Rhizobiaceae bacterium]